MSPAFMPPFPRSGAGVLAIESVLAGLMVGLFWVAYPEGFAKLGAVIASILLGSWVLAYSLGAKVRAAQSATLEARARLALVVGALFGVLGILWGFVGGPHLAGVAVYGVGAQLLVLLLGRMALAI
jgi:hypothetical protein